MTSPRPERSRRDDEEFYVGYAGRAPRLLARRIRGVTSILVAASAVVGVAVAALQDRFGPGIFEFGTLREFTGRIEAEPFPVLVLPRAGVDPEQAGATSRYLLTAPGKHGAQSLLAGWDGRTVQLRGTLAFREGRTLVEVAPGSIRTAPADSVAADAPVALGTVTVHGEIVDSKCYLGVMNPGSAKPHRACAVRCLSGGIPPLFIAADAPDGVAQMLLVGTGGRALNREILDFVAEPVAITGELSRTGDLWILQAEPGAIRRFIP